MPLVLERCEINTDGECPPFVERIFFFSGLSANYGFLTIYDQNETSTNMVFLLWVNPSPFFSLFHWSGMFCSGENTWQHEGNNLFTVFQHRESQSLKLCYCFLIERWKHPEKASSWILLTLFPLPWVILFLHWFWSCFFCFTNFWYKAKTLCGSSSKKGIQKVMILR